MENQLLNNSENILKVSDLTSKKVWQTPTVELVSITNGFRSGGNEGQPTIPGIVNPTYFSAYHS